MSINIGIGQVRVAQLEEAWTVNLVVGGSSPSCVIMKKSLRQAFNPKIAEFFGSKTKLGGSAYHNNIVGTLKIHLGPTHIGHVVRLPGADSPDVHSSGLH